MNNTEYNVRIALEENYPENKYFDYDNLRNVNLLCT